MSSPPFFPLWFDSNETNLAQSNPVIFENCETNLKINTQDLIALKATDNFIENDSSLIETSELKDKMFSRKDKKSNHHSNSNGSASNHHQQQVQNQIKHQQMQQQQQQQQPQQQQPEHQQHHEQFHFDNQPMNQPSYVNISRVNHGYVPYNRYTSEYRRDDSLLRYDEFTSLPLEDTSKGFLHRKIESLYGETFADDWEKTRVKKGQSIEQLPEDANKMRDQIKTTLASSKLFLKINSIDNSDLESKTIDKDADKDWWLREHQANRMHGPNDGKAFLHKLQEQRNRIQNKISRAEDWLTNSNNIPEECIGKIRAAIGKANLLLDKKFQQFQKLCEDSINQGDKEEFKIQNDDLQGFWDMVMIQINDVNQTFEHLIKLKQNQWINRMEQEPIKSVN